MSIRRLFSSVFEGKTNDLTGSYKAIDIAKYMVSRCSQDKVPISNLQLQKILYYSQREFLQKNKRVLFSEDIEAWTFGPVVSEVYYYFCGFGAFPIFYILPDETKISAGDLEIINKVIEEKRKLNPWVMVEDTHTKGKAWDLVYRDGEGAGDIIPKRLIATYG